MFQKLVSNLPYSPALASQVGYYAHRLKQEELTRKIGLGFIVMALLVQSLAILSPAEPSIAAGPNNILYHGARSKDDILQAFDTNNDGNGHQDIQQIFSHFGITRDNLSSGKVEWIRSTDQNRKLYSIGRHAYNKTDERAVGIPGTGTTVYVRPLWSWDSGAYSSYQALTGTNSKGQYFAILLSCGNITINIDQFDEPEPPASLLGAAEQLNCSIISGWAYDPNATNQSIGIQLHIDGILAQSFSTDQQSADINATYGIGGRHRFGMPVPTTYHDGSPHTLAIYAIRAEGSPAENRLIGGPVTVECPRPANLIQAPTCTTIELINFTARHSFEFRATSIDPTQKLTKYSYLIRNNDEIITTIDHENTSLSDTLILDSISDPGEYTIEVVLYTSDGIIENSSCSNVFEVAMPGQCPYKGNPSLDDEDEDCQPCEYDESLWHKNVACVEPQADVQRSKLATNLSQSINDANGTTARPGDRIEYKLITANSGNKEASVVVEENLNDVLQYADIVDNGGGTFNEQTGILYWDEFILEADTSVTHRFMVQVKTTIPETPRSAGNPEDYNLIMNNIYGDDVVEIRLPAPAAKQVEIAAQSLPNTGASTNVIIGAMVLMFATYFYSRNRQMSKEVQLVKKEFNYGS